VSKDGVSWSKAYSGKSTKTTNEQEHYRFTPVKARYVKLIGQGSSANAWNNISEFDAWGTGK
jgi:poly(beta-D-mannuronate) lyase